MKSKDQIDSKLLEANKKYYQIDKTEIFRGIHLCRQNAIDLFESANKVKLTVGITGPSNSLMILSAEECVKCYILCALYIDFQVPFELGPIFRDHSKKHVRGKEIQNLVNYLSPLIRFAAAERRRVKFKAVAELVLTIILPPKLDQWWQNANTDKNHGLYVDYSFENERFIAPNEISENDFSNSTEVVSNFIETIRLIEFLKPDDYKILVP